LAGPGIDRHAFLELVAVQPPEPSDIVEMGAVIDAVFGFHENRRRCLQMPVMGKMNRRGTA